MNEIEQIPTLTPAGAIREILKLSFPHCDDGNPNEKEFVEINKLAHETLKKIEKLAVKKPI